MEILLFIVKYMNYNFFLSIYGLNKIINYQSLIYLMITFFKK